MSSCGPLYCRRRPLWRMKRLGLRWRKEGLVMCFREKGCALTQGHRLTVMASYMAGYRYISILWREGAATVPSSLRSTLLSRAILISLGITCLRAREFMESSPKQSEVLNRSNGFGGFSLWGCLAVLCICKDSRLLRRFHVCLNGMARLEPDDGTTKYRDIWL